MSKVNMIEDFRQVSSGQEMLQGLAKVYCIVASS